VGIFSPYARFGAEPGLLTTLLAAKPIIYIFALTNHQQTDKWVA
jgi:hypothetical protein